MAELKKFDMADEIIACGYNTVSTREARAAGYERTCLCHSRGSSGVSVHKLLGKKLTSYGYPGDFKGYICSSCWLELRPIVLPPNPIEEKGMWV